MKLSSGILFAFMLSATAFSQSNGWIKISVPEHEGSPYAFVDFSDSLHGLLSSADGYLTLTSDGGRSWTAVGKIPSSDAVSKIKMADSGTMLLLVSSSGGTNRVYKTTNRGTSWDSLQLPKAFGGIEAISILNKDMIGCISLLGKNDSVFYFISTKNFGTAWDSVAIGRRRLSVFPTVAAVDSTTIFFGGSGGGFISGAYLLRSDDGGRTFVSLLDASPLSEARLKVYTKDLASFILFYYNDVYGWYSLLRYNIRSRQSALDSIWYDAPREGTVLNDGTRFVVSSGSHLIPAGDSRYTLSEYSSLSDSLKYSAIAIAGTKSYWYLTKEGRLFTNSENYQSDPVLRYYPLAVGNRWHYTISGGFAEASSMYVSVIKDTVLSNGKMYFKVENRTPQNVSYDYERIDSSSLNLFRVDLQNSVQETLLDSLRATEGDTIGSRRLSTPWVLCDSIVSRTTLGLSTHWKYFSGRVIPTFPQYALAQGLGLVYRTSLEEDPNYPRYSSRVTALVYARINGIEYGTPLSVNDASDHAPVGYSLGQNYPNPFNPSTTFSFTLPSKSHVSLKIFDVMGREIATIISKELPAGTYQHQWNASGFPSGVYFYRLQAGAYSETKRLVLVK